MTEDKFEPLHLSEEIRRALDVLGYAQPTQVQQEAIPFMRHGRDVIVKSQTGSGKTAAFAIPVCERVKWEKREPQALILTPTRELALQIQQEVFHIGRFKRLKVEAVFGRSSFEIQERNLKQRTHVVVATPGRLLDHIERGTIDLSQIQTVVIDEADEMLAMGFIDQIERVLEEVPTDVVKALFSATMPSQIQKLADYYLTDPQFIEVQTENKVEDRILQQYYRVDNEEKISLLRDVLVVDNPDSSIVFCNTRVAVEEVVDALDDLGVRVEMLHGGMEQRDRTKVINDFKHGMFRYLVATDVAARGLDIADISLVVNYDLPDNPETYVHRIGRTARFENHGKSVAFVNQFDGRRFAEIMEKQGNELQELNAPSYSLVNDRMVSFEAKQQRKPKIRQTKGHEFKAEIMKLHINAGKKTKMRAGDVVGALCQIEGMTADDIGVISLLDVSTFVEILNGKGPNVLKTLQTMPIKGRLRRVSKANETTYEREVRENS